MSYRRDNFERPVGSVEESNTSYQVIGTGGSVRHEGNFSPNNPYFAQLKLANNNKDKDALYAQAVEWEADYANRQIQLEENQAILDEQRFYDSPEQQLKRQREAGINPDIAAGNGGSSVGAGSSAQLANPQMADQAAQVKYNNAYDNTAEVLNGINTAAGVLSTFAGFGSAVVSAYDTLSTLPSRISLLDSQAYVADKTKDIAVSQAQATLDGTKLGNASKIIDTAKSTLSMYGDMASLFNSESTDEELGNAFSSLGISDEDRQMHIDGFRGYLKNPKAQASYAQSIKEKNEMDAYNSSFTPSVLKGLNDLMISANFQDKLFKMNLTDFQNSIVNYKRLYGVDALTAKSEFGGLTNDLQSQELAKIQLRDSIDSTLQTIEWIDNQKATLEQEKQAIIDRANDLKRPLTSIDKNQIKALDTKISYLETQSAKEKGEVLNTVLEAGINTTYMEMNQNKKGNFKRGTGNRNRQNEALFQMNQKIMNNTVPREEMGDVVMKYISQGLGIVEQGVGIVKDVSSIAGAGE